MFGRMVAILGAAIAGTVLSIGVVAASMERCVTQEVEYQAKQILDEIKAEGSIDDTMSRYEFTIARTYDDRNESVEACTLAEEAPEKEYSRYYLRCEKGHRYLPLYDGEECPWCERGDFVRQDVSHLVIIYMPEILSEIKRNGVYELKEEDALTVTVRYSLPLSIRTLLYGEKDYRTYTGGFVYGTH